MFFAKGLLSIGPFDEVELGVDQAADIITFHYFLSLLAEDCFQDLMNVVRLLVVFKATNCTLEYYKTEFENVKRTLYLEVDWLANRTFHEVLLGHVHLKNAG